VRDRIPQEAADQHVDPGVGGGREQQPLAVALGLVEQLGDGRQEWPTSAWYSESRWILLPGVDPRWPRRAVVDKKRGPRQC
jgi:hypothetical protein